VFFSSCPLLNKEVPCKLQYLDLSMAVISEEGTEKLQQFGINSVYVSVEIAYLVSLINESVIRQEHWIL
jgi:hypothetical protein